jgi:hypothetical protein
MSKKAPTPHQVVKEFGSRRQAAKALDLTTQAIGYWFKVDRVPDNAFPRLALARPQKWGYLAS